MKQAHKLIRITTVPLSLSVLLKDQLRYMSNHFDLLAVSSPDKLLDQVGTREGVRTAPVAMTRAITPVVKKGKAHYCSYTYAEGRVVRYAGQQAGRCAGPVTYSSRYAIDGEYR